MEMETSTGGRFSSLSGSFKALVRNLRSTVFEIARKTKKIGVEDPRRIIHSFKVALATTLVSLFYYFRPLYDGFGVAATWAVITVIVVFEFSVGATLGRGVNRGIATFIATSLGVGAHHVASFTGKICEPILLGFFVFILVSMATFIRFFPRMKARYDYGLIVFLLTFCLISVSSYREKEVLQMAHRRLSTILIGSATALIICIAICPVWAGNDLHNLVAANIEKLGTFLEGFEGEYFSNVSRNGEGDKNALHGYKSVLNSKSTEESLANFAKWEPRHGEFKFGHPWEQYVKIGALTRHCAYRIEALDGYLHSQSQLPLDVRAKIQDPCTKISSQTGQALKELSSSVKKMARSSAIDTHITNAKMAAENLKTSLNIELWQDTDLLMIIPVATVASLLVEITSCTEQIANSVNQLCSLARFKVATGDAIVEIEGTVEHNGQVRPCSVLEGSHHVVTITE